MALETPTQYARIVSWDDVRNSFPQPLTDIAEQWASIAVSPWEWKRCANQSGATGARTSGEAGGFFVSSDAVPGRRAYLKPIRRGRSRAAREKIASDLAQRLGVAVPPVLLYERRDAKANEERHVCISLLMYRKQFAWSILREYLPPQRVTPPDWTPILTCLPFEAAAAMAFDTWVDQADHNDHPSNMLLGFDDERAARLVLLDFAFSLGTHKRWQNEGWQKIGVAPFPPSLALLVDKPTLKRVVDDIQRIENDTIHDIVERVPAQWLSHEEKALVLQGILGRRACLEELLL